MRRKFPPNVLHSKAEWKKRHIQMHGELEPAGLELHFLKGATHSAKPFELPDNLKSVNSPTITDFVDQHQVTKIMISGHLDNPGSPNPHGYIEYEIDESGMDIILYRVGGDPQSKHVTITIEDVQHYNNHDNKWVYHELGELIETAGLLKSKAA